MLKSLILGVVVAIGSFSVGVASSESVASVETVVASASVVAAVTGEGDTIRLDIFYMYSNENGSYFLDPTADVENVIFVPYVALNEWDINLDTLHHGQKFSGLFDSEYEWELLGLEYVK